MVFGQHGFTGTSQDSAKRSRLHEIWPEATVAYPQGLAPGWQRGLGHFNDRDVKFYLSYPPATTNGAPTVVCYYQEGHAWPTDASTKIVDFFKQVAPVK
jgi:hypothetical protein